MVYRGRPSTGCKRCRERKVKCDERPGRCVKCEERKITCPGYDRTAHALFHDETAKVEAKAKLSNARADTVRKKQDGENMALVLSNAAESPKIHLLAPLIDQGISFFMAHHAVGLDQPSITSSEYNRYLSTDGFHPLILTTMTALGIAGVANLYMDPGLKCEATKWYLKAIRMANEAISSPTKVHKDTTLVAVNLLTLFEATFNEDSLSGWSHHVDGASLLIKVRGDDQVHTAAARRLYLHTVGLLTINCMGKGIPIPKYINRINQKMEKHLDRTDPRTAFFFLHLETANLRAHILHDTQLTWKKLSIVLSSSIQLRLPFSKMCRVIGVTIPCLVTKK